MYSYYVYTTTLPFNGLEKLPQGHRVHSVIRQDGACGQGLTLTLLIEVNTDVVETR